jgi:hypothetical protein
VRSRVLAIYRLEPDWLEALLPSGLEPRLNQGYAIGAVCYTRLGAPRLFRSRTRASDHLAYRFAVTDAKGNDATWVARRETSSWFEATCGARLLRGEYGRSSFQVTEDAQGIELAVQGEHGVDFYLRGENSGAGSGSLFSCAQDLDEFLGTRCAVRPHDLLAPEADALELTRHVTSEPLVVFESRSPFLDAGQLDSAWRIVRHKLALQPRRRQSFRVLPGQGSSVPALP